MSYTSFNSISVSVRENSGKCYSSKPVPVGLSIQLCLCNSATIWLEFAFTGWCPTLLGQL